jgi:hypothetical protein
LVLLDSVVDGISPTAPSSLAAPMYLGPPNEEELLASPERVSTAAAEPEYEDEDPAGSTKVYEPSSCDEDLFEDEFLKACNLVVNTRVRALICKLCGVAIPPQNVRGHFENRHRTIIPSLDINDLKHGSLIERYGKLVDHEPTKWIPEILPASPLSFVAIHDGYSCVAASGLPTCYKSFRTLYRTMRHIRESHPEESRYTVTHSKLQTAYGTTLRQLFPVLVPENIPTGAMELYRSYVQQKACLNADNEVVESDEQKLHPFLRTYRWYAVIQAFDRRQMFDQIDHPTKPWEKRIKTATDLYFSDINKRIGAEGIHNTIQEQLSIKSVQEQ